MTLLALTKEENQCRSILNGLTKTVFDLSDYAIALKHSLVA